MTCSEVQPHLSAQHDDELDASLRQAVADHVTQCPACLAYLQELSQLSGLLQRGRNCNIPGGMWERIAAAAGRPRRHLRLYKRLSCAGAAAAGFTIYLAGHGVIAPSTQSAPTPQVAQALRVEQVLRDTGFVLAGRGLDDDELASLDRRPEVLLLHELTERTEP